METIGRGGGIRTRTGRILSPLSLPLDYTPIQRIGDRAPPLGLVRPIVPFRVVSSGIHKSMARPGCLLVLRLTPHFRTTQVCGSYLDKFTGLAPARGSTSSWELPSLIGVQSTRFELFTNQQPTSSLLSSPKAYDIVQWVMTPTEPFGVCPSLLRAPVPFR